MIDMVAVRAHIASELTSRLGVLLADPPDVLPRGVDGPFDPPVVVLGQPDVEFDVEPCLDKWTLSVAVVVRVDPSGMTATQTQLEELWPAVATAVREMCSDDQSLGGLVASARALSADFGDFKVGSQTFPAQAIQLEIY